MTEFFLDIGAFAGKALIVLVLIACLGAVLGSALSEHKRGKKKKKLQIDDIGQELKIYSLKTHAVTHSTKVVKKQIKSLKKQQKEDKSQGMKAYVLDFKGDLEASQVHLLRDEVSILMRSADPKRDEIIVRLNNRGGAVHNHGLGASQLERLRNKGFKLTVCVDEVAASGGYLMACMANKILSAPFAVIGSIGVLSQTPNFYRFLQKKEVDFEEHHAGQHKRTLTMFGKATDEKRAKLKEQLEEVHGHFKNYVAKYRTKVDMSKVATGEYWYGTRAKELGLVDDIMVSDDYILSLLDENKKVYHLSLKEEELTNLQKLLGKKIEDALSLLFSVGKKFWIRGLKIQ